MNYWLVRLARGLISLVNDNHVDNDLKVILVYVYLYFGSLVNANMRDVNSNIITTQ